MDRSTPFSIAFFTLHLIGFRGNRAGRQPSNEQESSHHEISLTSGMANSNDYFLNVGGATLVLYQENTSIATLAFGTTVEQSGDGGGGEVVVYCIMDRHT